MRSPLRDLEMQKVLVFASGHKRFRSFKLRRWEEGFERGPVGRNREVVYCQRDAGSRFIYSPCERQCTRTGGGCLGGSQRAVALVCALRFDPPHRLPFQPCLGLGAAGCDTSVRGLFGHRDVSGQSCGSEHRDGRPENVP